MKQDLNGRIEKIKSLTARELQISIEDLEYITSKFISEFNNDVRILTKRD
ncbi:hypothetical protein EV144_1011411 [Flavobacterium sp. 270]|nr:hypothetical protein [Flavobacterium sp. 270]TDW52719.1 hypothetical protein EV144_1011411 [Flavobacterium sp. 270]